MKKILLLLFIITLFYACKKDKNDEVNNTVNINHAGPPPSIFTKKIMLEMFTGEWNPNCPIGQDTLNAMINIDTNIITACIHQGDWLSITPFYDALNIHFGGINGFPRAAMNRVPATKGTQLDSITYSIYNWRINMQEIRMTKTSDVGLALYSKESNNNLEISVYIAYNQAINKKTRLTVYLIEDSIRAHNQLNADTNFIHQRVVKKVLTSYLGDSIAMLDGAMITKNYSMNLNGYYENKNNLKLVAFVNIVGDDFKQNEILNIQEAKLKQTKKWD